MPSGPQIAIMPDEGPDAKPLDGRLLQTAANSPAASAGQAKLLSATIAARKANAKAVKPPKEHHWSVGESDPATGLSGIEMSLFIYQFLYRKTRKRALCYDIDVAVQTAVSLSQALLRYAQPQHACKLPAPRCSCFD
jgi:hypothetical protein